MLRRFICDIAGHKYGSWENGLNQPCLFYRICGRCGEQEERIEHDWSYREEDSAKHLSECRRCDRKIIEDHVLTWKSIDSDYHVQCCGVCTFQDMQSKEVHVWSEGDWVNPHETDRWKYFHCSKCYTETVDVG